ncbi:unnamed protein product [Pylaiella littoralis]
MLTTYRCASIDIGVVNLALCVTEFTELGDGKFRFNVTHLERASIGSPSETMHVLGRKLVKFYAGNKALAGRSFDFVFIEQQLSRAVKNYVLSYVTLSYFETVNVTVDRPDRPAAAAAVVFVSPKNKFRAVRHAFPEAALRSIDFERRGRGLKKLSVEIARLLFDAFAVDVGLKALREYGSKLDDISDVFLQSFAFFLNKKVSRDREAPWFISVEEHAEGKDPEEQA